MGMVGMFLSLTLQELLRRVSLDSQGPLQNNPVLSSSGSQQPSEEDEHLPWSCRIKVRVRKGKNVASLTTKKVNSSLKSSVVSCSQGETLNHTHYRQLPPLSITQEQI